MSSKSQPRLIAVMGQTASGKTALAEALAERFGGLLVNADAFQLYRGMDIGTAKPSSKDHYALIDLLEPSEASSVGEWLDAANPILQDAFERGQDVIVVGGTGLYVRALTESYRGLSPPPPEGLRESIRAKLEAEGLASLVEELRRRQPDVAAKTDLRNPLRVTRALERAMTPTPPNPVTLPPFAIHKLAIDPELSEIEGRIERRTNEMLKAGWLEEVQSLLEQGYTDRDPGFRAIGYATLAKVLRGEASLDAAAESVVLETRQYAKRQRTWLRSEPRLVMLSQESPFAEALSRLA